MANRNLSGDIQPAPMAFSGIRIRSKTGWSTQQSTRFAKPMLIKALIAFLTLPTIISLIIPITWLWHSGNTQLVQPIGLILLAVGSSGILWCVRDFYVKGKGTLAPMVPPQKLVISGLYRYSRNPMYVSVGLVLLGWAVSFNNVALYIYTALVVTGFHLFIVFYEEPWLKRKYGSDYEEYTKGTPRWLW